MNIIDTIIRDVCETDRADPCLRNTVCIDVEDLRVIIANNLTPTTYTDAFILEALTIPGLNVEASFEPRELPILLDGIRNMLKEAAKS